MPQKLFFWALLSACGTLAVLCAQDPDKSSPDAKSFQFTGAVDVFYSFNTNNPASGTNQLRNFDTKDSLALGFASVSIQENGPRFGFRADAGCGEMYNTLSLSDSWGGPNRYISQAYISYQPSSESGLQFQLGKFFPNIGGEATESYNNFNYSRSLLNALGEPSNNFGLSATIPITKSLSAGVQLLNGTSSVRDLDASKVVTLFSITGTRKKWTWSDSWMVGPVKEDGEDGFRQIQDAFINYTPAPWINGYVEGLYGTEKLHMSGRNSWYAAATAARFTPFGKWSFSPRFDWFTDANGDITGVFQHLKEVTFTAEYRLSREMISRAEYRRDWSEVPYFDCGSSVAACKSQTTMLVAWILVFKRER